MSATNTQMLGFGNHEVSDATVNWDHRQTSRPAHNLLLPAALGRHDRPNRAWPTAQGLIYVVATYPRLAHLAETILEADGFSTCAFDDRAMAWHAFAFAKPKPMLLITDNLDGETAGREFFDRCRSLAPGLKTLLVDHRQSFNQQPPAWVDGLLSLPYWSATLIKEVKRLCPGRADLRLVR